MAEQRSTEGSSSSEVPAGSGNSDSIVQLNVKTLDSRSFSFEVDKNMPVSSLKEKIASQIGLPVAQQRLIFRGKVLKDDHLLAEYHVENGHSLHLVERQSVQQQSSSGDNSSDMNANNYSQGNDANVGMPRNRIGQISHAVLGTFNVGDQGEGIVPDLTQVLGAVLNLLGVSNPPPANVAVGLQNTSPSSASGQASEANNTEGVSVNTGAQSQAGNQRHSGQPFPSQRFQFPMGSASLHFPSLHTPIPDSLNTLSEFMNRMEGVLMQNGQESNSSTVDNVGQPPVQLPVDARGLPTPEALCIVLRNAEHLLSGGAVNALSRIAGRLEQEGGSTDPSVRSQIESEAVQVGLAMQHLGALFLELGRTILTLRLGQSPEESVINAGPAVYISPSGPNPIMVQPFPLQSSPLFNTVASPPNAGAVGPVGVVGSTPRQVNIHIHAGTSVAPVVSAIGARAAGREGSQGERTGSIGESRTTRVFPVRNIIATAVPRPAVMASPVPTMGHTTDVSTSQPLDSAPLSSVISDVNSRIRNFVDNLRAENQTPSGPQENPVATDASMQPIPVGGMATDFPSFSAEGMSSTDQSHVVDAQNQKDLFIQHDEIDISHSKDESSCPTEASAGSSVNAPEHAPKSTEAHGKLDVARDVPLGLGLGGLQPKRRSRQSKTQLESGDGEPSAAPLAQRQQAAATGRQVLQSLASLSSTVGRNAANNGGARQNPQVTTGMPTGHESSNVVSSVSQLIQNPAFDGILSGLAGQTGVGSADNMRTMFQQFCQNPALRNTINQVAQQVDTSDLQRSFAGSGQGQVGGIDLSGMIQQMMPIVSSVFSSSSSAGSGPNIERGILPQYVDRRPSGPVNLHEQNSEIDVQEIGRIISQGSPPRDVFHGMIETAVHYGGSGPSEFVEELSSDEDLAKEFMEMLRRDLLNQVRDETSNGGM